MRESVSMEIQPIKLDWGRTCAYTISLKSDNGSVHKGADPVQKDGTLFRRVHKEKQNNHAVQTFHILQGRLLCM